jgi:nitroreductase/NAD-dependent dihydropyrimidine dehydrogenase PreA subunit
MDMIAVDLGKCTRCGLCARICPYVVLEMDEEKGPLAKGKFCISCGHCVAVCPTGAMDNINAPKAKQVPDNYPALGAAQAAHFLRSRRSVRWFKNTPVREQDLLTLLDMARFAPTASNSQGITFLVIENPETLRAVSSAVIDWGRSALEDDLPVSTLMHGLLDRYSEGTDSVTFNAPALVIALAEAGLGVNFPRRPRENSIFSLMYAHLFAPSLGLASCWLGVLEACALSGCLPLLNILQLPENLLFGGALAVGYPQYKHKNLTDRNPLQMIRR